MSFIVQDILHQVGGIYELT